MARPNPSCCGPLTFLSDHTHLLTLLQSLPGLGAAGSPGGGTKCFAQCTSAFILVGFLQAPGGFCNLMDAGDYVVRRGNYGLGSL